MMGLHDLPSAPAAEDRNHPAPEMEAAQTGRRIRRRDDRDHPDTLDDYVQPNRRYDPCV